MFAPTLHRRLLVLLAIAGCSGHLQVVWGEEARPSRRPAVVNRIPLEDQEANPGASDESLADAPPAGPGPHPLIPALKIAYRSHEYLSKQVRDYSCRIVLQERIEGRLRPVQHIDAKARHRWEQDGQLVHPRAVYLHYVAPQTAAGGLVLWVEG
jgi:hypothetical protein